MISKTRDTCFVHLSLLCTLWWGLITRRLVGRSSRETCLQNKFLVPQPDWGQGSETGLGQSWHWNFQLGRTRVDYKNNKVTRKLWNLPKINGVGKRDSREHERMWQLKRKKTISCCLILLNTTSSVTIVAYPLLFTLCCQKNTENSSMNPTIIFSNCGRNQFILIDKICCASSWQWVSYLRRSRFS